MKIRTEDLRAAFQLLDHVPQMDTIESSRFIRCLSIDDNMVMHLAGTLTGFSNIKVKNGSKLKFHLDRKALGGFLAAATGDEITMQSGDKILLQQGRNKLEVAKPADVGGYANPPEIKKGKRLELTPEEFTRLQMLTKYIPRKSIDERYSALQGIKGFGWLAMDGMVMTAWKCDIDSNTAIPGALFQAMQEGDEFSLHDGVAVCKTKAGILSQSLHADLSLFPIDKTKGVAEKSFAAKPVAEVQMEAWLNALRYFEGFPMEDAYLDCEAGKAQLQLRLSGPGIKVETVIPAKVTGTTEKMRWELSKLSPWAAAVGSKIIRVAVIDGLTAFSTENKHDLLMMVMARKSD